MEKGELHTSLPVKILLKTHKLFWFLFVLCCTIGHMSMGMQYIVMYNSADGGSWDSWYYLWDLS